MKDCVKKDVCRYFIALGSGPEDPCSIIETCKFCVRKDSNELKKGKEEKVVKRHYKKRVKLEEPIEDDSGITEKQFKKAKKKIINAKQNKGITENQEKALKAMKGLRFKKMTEGQKRQLINIANDL